MSKLETYASSMLHNSLYGVRKGKIDKIIESKDKLRDYVFNDKESFARNSSNNIPPHDMKSVKNMAMSIYGIPNDEMTPCVKGALESLINELIKLKSERVRLMSMLRTSENLADTDPLSGIFNRRAFERETLRSLSFFARYDTDACFAFIDLNGFKLINDSFGHQIGDLVIKEVAKTLSKNIRESDILGRLGGDEFAILLANTTLDEAQRKFENLENELANINIEVGGFRLDISASYGITEVYKNDSLECIIDRADKAMYAFKEEKKAKQENKRNLRRSIQ